jgi:hypothetical protein
MNRKYSRLVCSVALLLVLSFVMLPSAEARNLTGSRTAATGPQDLWSSAIAWLAHLLPGNAGQPVRHLLSASLTGGTGGGGYTTNTGPCIDPLGVNRCQPVQ